MIKGLRESLKTIKNEELQNLFARYERLAEATRAAIVALGLQLYAPKSSSNAVTAVLSPEGVDGIELVNHMREKHGIIIAGGQGQAKGKIFRVAHMGYADKFDMIMVMSALEMTLNTLGYEVELGKGVKAALSLLSL